MERGKKGLDSKARASSLARAGPVVLSPGGGTGEAGSAGPASEGVVAVVLDLAGHELAVGVVVRFWCTAIDAYAQAFVESIAPEQYPPGVVRLRAIDGSVRGLTFEVWAADCAVQRGPNGRPLRVVECDGDRGSVIAEEAADDSQAAQARRGPGDGPGDGDGVGAPACGGAGE